MVKYLLTQGILSLLVMVILTKSMLFNVPLYYLTTNLKSVLSSSNKEGCQGS